MPTSGSSPSTFRTQSMSTTGRSISVCASTNTMASPRRRKRNRALGSPITSSQRNTVLRISYARTMETPFNENLVLASLGCLDPVIAAFQSFVAGGPMRVDKRRSPPATAMNSMRVSRRRLASTWFWTANTSGSTLTTRSTLACSAIHRSLIRSSGPIRRFPDMQSVSPCPTFMG